MPRWGWVISAFFAGCILSQISFAMLADRFGRWKVMSAGLVPYTITGLAFATSDCDACILFHPRIYRGAILILSLQLALAVCGVRLLAGGFNMGTWLRAFNGFISSGGGLQDWSASTTILFATLITVSTPHST
ncbi:MAG: MFS transporter [Nitrososphaerota archaeon]